MSDPYAFVGEFVVREMRTTTHLQSLEAAIVVDALRSQGIDPETMRTEAARDWFHTKFLTGAV